jgi:hypothetical protein
VRILGVAIAVAVVACGGVQHARPTTGSIAGLARDHESGDPIAKAQIRIRSQGQLESRLLISKPDGSYQLGGLAPGRYNLTALFAGQPIDVSNIDVHAGQPTIVDVTFTLGQPDPVHVDYGNPKEGEIDRFRPHNLAPEIGIIEGTVNDAGTRERVSGAVVTAIGGPGTTTFQTVSDDQGRYRFDAMMPGTYAVSAYYTIGGRGQIEVRRSDIAVAGAEAVFVPLWVELTKQ